MTRRPRHLLLAVVVTGLTVTACTEEAPNPVPDGDPEAGRAAILQHGCASCHAIPGVPSVVDGMGPDLHDFDDQLYIAGQLPNRPEELIRWIRDPQVIEPGTAMPDTGVTEEEARDIAAYLYAP